MTKTQITFFTGMGAGLEHYDYVLSSIFAGFISQSFFPAANHTAALFTLFTVLAISNILKPVGAVIFGILGDRYGRREVFTSTLLWMAFFTVLIGLIPNYTTLGVTASILFGICRIAQSIVFGAEVPGAATLLIEHLDGQRLGLHFGFMSAIVGVGVLIGSLVSFLITRLLNEAQMLTWGFRLPFLLGGSLALVGFFIRKNLPETPTFLRLKQSQARITRQVIKEHVGSVINVIGVLLFPASLIIWQLVFPTYLHSFYHFAFTDIYLAMTYGYIISMVLIPVFGWVSDLVGRKTLLIVAAGLMILLVFPIFGVLRTWHLSGVYVFYFFTQFLASLLTASYYVLLPQSFKSVIRFTGTACSYNVTFALTSFLPLLINYIFGVVQKPYYLAWVFILFASISICSTCLLKIKVEGKA